MWNMFLLIRITWFGLLGMIWIYRILFPVLMLLALPRYAYRMWKRGGYRQSFGNRFGRMQNIPSKPDGVKRIWIQAVSVGETLAVQPLLKELYQRGYQVFLTVTTSTALKLATERLGDRTHWIGVFPVDCYFFSKAAWRSIQPDLMLLTETELWPEHLRQARNHGVPVMLINARLSDRSFKRFDSLRKLANPLFGGVDAILASTAQDLNRFDDLGWGQTRQLSGNLKFDVAIQEPDPQQVQRLRTELACEPESRNTVWIVGASTWPGEEIALVRACEHIRERGTTDLRLVLVPRHAERRNEIQRELAADNLRVQFRSSEPIRHPDCWVYVADTTGELRCFIELADIAFIGKSMPPHSEGQTPIEAAAAGKAIVMGPGMSNFREAAHSIIKADAALVVGDSEELMANLRLLVDDKTRREKMGSAGKSLFARNAGATENVLKAIDTILSS